MEHKKEVLLPKTKFTPKSEYQSREPKLRKLWKENDVFKTRNELNKNGETFRLHDGPPYANGELHLGHYLNKLLKDSFMKYNLMQGKNVDMRLGFDCHGLPTELEVLKLQPELSEDDNLLRRECFKFSRKQMQKQLKQMDKWGLTHTTKEPYYTTSKEYEHKELKMLHHFLNSDMLYQEKRPVWYSPTSQSVLAESELEYKEVETNTLYVRFRCQDFYFLVWTTQPWTLLGNKGLGVNPELTYKKVLYQDEYYVFEEGYELEGSTTVETLKGDALLDLFYENPFTNRLMKVVKADFVDGSGTGVVHLCPMHGDADYDVLKMQEENLVDSDGYLSNGVYWENSYEYMRDLCANNDSLFEEYVHTHDYPFDWRTKRRVLMMLENQFFLDLTPMKSKLSKLDEVKYTTPMSKYRLKDMCEGRDRWCLSRQRKWGFPLALFLDKDGNPFVNGESQRHLEELFKESSSMVWFTSSVEDLLPDSLKHMKDELTKCEFTMDVWFDSSVSWNTVLNGEKADMYVEGTDQARGWFQGSFLTRVGYDDEVPFKKLFTHGFVVDEKGRKMSKSLGNGVEVNDLMKNWNSDVLRLWTYYSNVWGDVRYSDKVMKGCGEAYFKLRNTLRFFLGNLYGYNGEEFELNSSDARGLKMGEELVRKCSDSMEDMNLRMVFEHLMNFVKDYSSKYLDLDLKCDLYEAELTDEKRLRRQEVLHKTLLNLLKVLAYVTPYLAEDAYQNLKLKGESSVFFL